jgi:hypothetical protein
VAPSRSSILTVKRARPPRPTRRRTAQRSHVARERIKRARRAAERALPTGGPLEDHPADQAAANATADTAAADPSQEFGFER